MSKVFCVDTKRYINDDSINELTVTGQTQKLGSVRCAVLRREGDSRTYLKPWDTVAFLRRPGEQNISAKLKTKQVRQIVKDAYLKPHDEVTFASMAEQYGVTAKTISDIVHGRAWRHVTVGLIAQLKSGNKEVLESCVSASNNLRRKNTKLNASMAKFNHRFTNAGDLPAGATYVLPREFRTYTLGKDN